VKPFLEYETIFYILGVAQHHQNRLEYNTYGYCTWTRISASLCVFNVPNQIFTGMGQIK
jgi:hypothetical protein